MGQSVHVPSREIPGKEHAFAVDGCIALTRLFAFALEMRSSSQQNLLNGRSAHEATFGGILCTYGANCEAPQLLLAEDERFTSTSRRRR